MLEASLYVSLYLFVGVCVSVAMKVYDDRDSLGFCEAAVLVWPLFLLLGVFLILFYIPHTIAVHIRKRQGKKTRNFFGGDTSGW